MRLHSPTRRTIIEGFVASTATSAASDKEVLALVKAMEARDGLVLVTPSELHNRKRRSAQSLDAWPAISPDALAICWMLVGAGRDSLESPALIVESLKNGTRSLSIEGRVASGVQGISSGPEIIVMSALSLKQHGRRSVLALDLRSGLAMYDLTPFVTEFEAPELEIISVSGSGAIAALASREQMQVIEIPSGKTVYTGPGRFPRLSPDGTRLAFIRKERLYTRSLLDGSTVELLPETRVMGAGGWSPDGRFLLAGAWTRFFAFEKRQIILDMATRRYGVLGKLGDGDYGNQFAWISTKLLGQ